MHVFRILRQLKHAIRQAKPDYVYFSIMPVGRGFWRDLLFVRQIRKHGVKTIYHLHNRGMGKRTGNPLFRLLYRYVYQDSIIIHLSESLMRKEMGGLNLKGCLTKVIPNGLPVVKPVNRVKVDPITNILFVSNLFAEKGMVDLLQIMKILRDNQSAARLHIVGEFMRDRYRKRYMKMIHRSGLNESVCLEGPRFGEEKWKAYQDADIFLFPTRFEQESFPLVVIEAMQFGLPVLASRIGAIPEIIDHGVSGYTFEPSDHQAFARVIMEMIERKELMQKVGMEARKKFLEQYTAVHLENNIRELYDHCLADIR